MAAIRHIEIWVSDLEAATKFYADVLGSLGWKQIDKNGFLSEGIKIYLAEVNNIGSHKTFGPRHICFSAESKVEIDELAELLKRKGAEVIHGPGELHPANYMIVFKDLDGYILEASSK